MSGRGTRGRIGALGLALLALIVVALVASIRRTTDDPAETRDGRSPRHTARPSEDPVRAATRFLSGLTLTALVEDGQRRRFIARWAARGAEPDLQWDYAAEAERIAAAFAGRPRVARAAFLGYQLTRRPGGTADVELWVVSLGGAGTSPVAVGWRTIRVQLVQVRRDWKIVRVREGPGPSPEMSVTALESASRRFGELRVAP